MARNLRKALVHLLKLAVAAALLCWALHGVEWSRLGQRVAGANWPLLAAATAGFLLPILTMSLRWWCLLRVQQIRLSARETIRLTFLGQFLGFVVPGMVSGDLVKAWYAFKHTDRKAAAVVSVFVDRAAGLAAFAVVPAAVMAVMIATGTPPGELALPATVVSVVLGALAVVAVLLLSGRLRKALRLDRILARLPLQQQVKLTGEAVRLYGRRWPVVAAALGITFVGQAIFVTAILVAGLALAPQIPWYRYYIYVPLIYIIAAVPISPGGIGVTEACYVKFLAVGGVSDADAIVVAIAARVLPMLCSLPGLVVAVTGPKLPKAEQMQAEIGAEPELAEKTKAEKSPVDGG